MNRIGLFLAFLIAGVALAQSQPAPSADVHRVPPAATLLILTDERPLLVQIRIIFDGQPLEQHWRETAQRMFRALDTNGDGRLTKPECARLLGDPVLAAIAGPIARAAPTAHPQEAGMTFEEFLINLRQIGRGPIQVSQYGNTSAGLYVQGRPLAQTLSQTLFTVLDTNGDGKLDTHEMDQAARLLAQLDEDEDEYVTAGEIFNGYAARRSASARPGNDKKPQAPPNPPPISRILLLNTGSAEESAVGALQLTYSREDAAIVRRRLQREDIRIPVELFQQLDKNGDGWLDYQEMRAFLRRAPDAEVTLRLESSKQVGQRPRAQFIEARARFGCQVSRTDSDVVVGTEQSRVRLSANAWLATASGAQEQAQTNFVETGLKNLGRLFMLADNDQNGYLDEMEFNRFHRSVPLLAEAKFSDLDRDRDGKVFRAEYEAFLREALQVQFLLRELGLRVALTSEGPELFRTLDANGDGKLSPREWQRAPVVLRNYDRNGDGVLEWNELVGHYDLNIGLSDVLSGLAGVFPPWQQPRAPRPAMRPELRHNVPAWFRAMDRNGDGEISRREFPGTEAEFRQLDTDGDGLISLDEALAALRTLPTTQPPLPPHPHQPRR